MPRTVAIIQARMGSTRLPGKVLMDLGGKPVLQWVVEAAKAVRTIDRVIVATPDNDIYYWCWDHRIEPYIGFEADVLRRFYGAAAQTAADIIVRLTADCPLLDPRVIAQVIELRRAKKADYASNVNPPTWPDGLDCEVFTRAALEMAEEEATKSSDREHVTPYMRRKRKFKKANLRNPAGDQSHIKLSIDTIEDLERVRAHIRKVA